MTTYLVPGEINTFGYWHGLVKETLIAPHQHLTAKTNCSMNFKCQAFQMRCIFKKHVDAAWTVPSLTLSNHTVYASFSVTWIRSTGAPMTTSADGCWRASLPESRQHFITSLRASSPCSWHACPASHSGDYLNNWFQNLKSHSCESHAYKQAAEPFFSGGVFGSCWWGMHVLWAWKTR